jgi:hypothetical protein
VTPMLSTPQWHTGRARVVNDSALSVATILLRLQIENNNRHLRGKKRTIEAIERWILPIYGKTRHLRTNEYQMKIPYRTDPDLDKIMDDLLREIAWQADVGNCFSESEALLEGTDRSW